MAYVDGNAETAFRPKLKLLTERKPSDNCHMYAYTLVHHRITTFQSIS